VPNCAMETDAFAAARRCGAPLIANVMHLRLPLCFLLLVPALAGAEHACVDGYPMGAPIKLTQPLPSEWFRVGSADVRKEPTHSALKQRYGKNYLSSYDEGPFGSLCLKLKVGYVEVTTSDFGSGVQYSMLAPKCARCVSINVTGKEFTSGTGLRLGMTKARTSELLKTKIIADLTDLTFEETQAVGAVRVLHTESLSLEFKDNRLIRFSVYDYQEGA
jgi:hypothetical protein